MRYFLVSITAFSPFTAFSHSDLSSKIYQLWFCEHDVTDYYLATYEVLKD